MFEINEQEKLYLYASTFFLKNGGFEAKFRSKFFKGHKRIKEKKQKNQSRFFAVLSRLIVI